MSRSTQRLAVVSLFAMAVLAAPVWVFAQDSADDPADAARVQLGPLGIEPRVSLTNVGMDSNVLNSPTDARRDYTATLVPGADTYLHAGRALFTGKSSVEWLYFKETASQRSFAASHEERVDVSLARVTPFLSAGYLNSYQRPNAEIDVRIRRNTQTMALGARLALGARTDLVIEGHRDKLNYGDARFDGVDLSQELNRESTRSAATFNIALTPLTTFFVRGEMQQDRFDSAVERNTDSLSVLPGFELKPLALISGSAEVGYRRFHSLTGALPDFTGAVAHADVVYHVRETTRIGVQASRDVDYSYQIEQPYFVLTGGQLSLTQGIGARWDGVLRAGEQMLEYQNLRAASPFAPAAAARTDRQIIYGAGVGYHFASGLRVGFDAVYERRLSPDESRRYRGFRCGGSVTYGS